MADPEEAGAAALQKPALEILKSHSRSNILIHRLKRQINTLQGEGPEADADRTAGVRVMA